MFQYDSFDEDKAISHDSIKVYQIHLSHCPKSPCNYIKKSVFEVFCLHHRVESVSLS